MQCHAETGSLEPSPTTQHSPGGPHVLTCDCGANPEDTTETHAPDCIHWDLPLDAPSDHYGQ